MGRPKKHIQGDSKAEKLMNANNVDTIYKVGNVWYVGKTSAERAGKRLELPVEEFGKPAE